MYLYSVFSDDHYLLQSLENTEGKKESNKELLFLSWVTLIRRSGLTHVFDFLEERSAFSRLFFLLLVIRHI
jgi:hypothetical protein